LDPEEEELVMPFSSPQRTPTNRIANEQPASSTITPSTSNSSLNTNSNTTTTATSKPTPSVQDPNEADPDDSLGAPPAYTPSAQNPFMNNPLYSPQHQQALTRLMHEDHDRSNNTNGTAMQQPAGYGNTPSGFTVITPQVDQTARSWKMLHFVLSVLFGLGIVFSEYSHEGDLGRFQDLATDKPDPHGVYGVVSMVRLPD
jgi:hypothetical protein